MNLHQIASRVISRVNPNIQAELWHSAGYTTSTDGTQVPSYTKCCGTVQVQSLSNDELKQLEGLNLQGNKNAVYLSEDMSGIVRLGRQGGDLLVFGGNTWLVVTVLENWNDYTKVAVVMQNGS